MTLSEIQRALNIGTAKAMRVQAIMSDVERTCGTCRHYDGDHGTTDGVQYGFCTNRRAWHSGRSMPPFDGCIAWAARDEEDGA
jgi:hypothetical protein